MERYFSILFTLKFSVISWFVLYEIVLNIIYYIYCIVVVIRKGSMGTTSHFRDTICTTQYTNMSVGFIYKRIMTWFCYEAGFFYFEYGAKLKNSKWNVL